jgi:hypothetical protein
MSGFDMDEFDDLATGSVETAPAASIPPEGVSLAMVVDAGRRKNKFKACPENPNGWQLALTLQVQVGYDKVTFRANVPAHKAAVIGHVFASAGLSAPVRGTRLNEGQLVGRSVEVEIEHYTPDGGDQVFPIVKKWLPAGSADRDPPGLPPASELAKPAARRTTAKKADVVAKEASPDDIPF